MLSGTDGSDTHKYQSRTVSNYLKNQYGLSTEEAEYITSQANAEIQKTTNANTDKYYEYAATYAKEHDADEVFDYLNRYYENNKISAEEADEIYRRDVYKRQPLRSGILPGQCIRFPAFGCL